MATSIIDRVSVRTLDDLDAHCRYAQTFATMLCDLIGADDEIPPELDINDPASRTQRMFATLEGLRSRLNGISACESSLRAEAGHV